MRNKRWDLFLLGPYLVGLTSRRLAISTFRSFAKQFGLRSPVKVGPNLGTGGHCIHY